MPSEVQEGADRPCAEADAQDEIDGPRGAQRGHGRLSTRATIWLVIRSLVFGRLRATSGVNRRNTPFGMARICTTRSLLPSADGAGELDGDAMERITEKYGAAWVD